MKRIRGRAHIESWKAGPREQRGRAHVGGDSRVGKNKGKSTY